MLEGRDVGHSDDGSAQLPIVSVFLVLICMIAALGTYATPSEGNFETARASLKSVFQGRNAVAEVKKPELSSQILERISTICQDFSANCSTQSQDGLEGRFLALPALSLARADGGLDPLAEAFLQAMSTLGDLKNVRLSFVLNAAADLNDPNIIVVADLLRRYTGVLVTIERFSDPISWEVGILVMPKG
ncbi:MAG: hypothetical protein AAGJ09_02965 [Pseudomonadota bacterium]